MPTRVVPVGCRTPRKRTQGAAHRRHTRWCHKQAGAAHQLLPHSDEHHRGLPGMGSHVIVTMNLPKGTEGGLGDSARVTRCRAEGLPPRGKRGGEGKGLLQRGLLAGEAGARVSSSVSRVHNLLSWKTGRVCTVLQQSEAPTEGILSVTQGPPNDRRTPECQGEQMPRRTDVKANRCLGTIRRNFPTTRPQKLIQSLLESRQEDASIRAARRAATQHFYSEKFTT